MNKCEPRHARSVRFRFGLRALLITVAGFAVAFAFVFVLLPELWSLATETAAAKRIFAGLLFVVPGFALIIGTSILMRITMSVGIRGFENLSKHSQRR